MQFLNTFTFMNPYYNNEQFQQMTRNLPFLKKYALHCLFSQPLFPSFTWKEGTLVIEIYNFACFTIRLTFDNTFEIDSSIMYQRIEQVAFDTNPLNDSYRINLSIQEENKDEPTYISIIFEDVQVEVNFENVLSNTYFEVSPWNYFAIIALFLRIKYEVFPKNCNTLEEDLMPLMDELALLCENSPYSGQVKCPKLKELASHHNLSKLINKLDKLESATIESFAFEFHKLEVMEILNAYENRQIWYDLYSQIEKSQEEYPNRDLKQDTTLIREQITNQLLQLGYEGSYPTFYKYNDINRIYMTLSYENPVFGGFNRNAISYIHCKEILNFEGKLHVQLLASTNLKPENTDVYSTYFDRKGKCIFDYVIYDPLKENFLNEYIQSAVNISQLIRLNRKQQDIYENNSFGPLLFIGIFIVVGGLFAILMCLGFFVLSYSLVFLFSNFEETNRIVFNLPWKIIFFSLWVAFGSLSAIVHHIASNK